MMRLILYPLFFQALQELKDTLAEKERRVNSLKLELQETEYQLQRTGQDLYIEQEHSAKLEAEVILYEPSHEKTTILHMRKQRCRSASRLTAKLISAFVFAT